MVQQWAVNWINAQAWDLDRCREPLLRAAAWCDLGQADPRQQVLRDLILCAGPARLPVLESIHAQTQNGLLKSLIAEVAQTLEYTRYQIIEVHEPRK